MRRRILLLSVTVAIMIVLLAILIRALTAGPKPPAAPTTPGPTTTSVQIPASVAAPPCGTVMAASSNGAALPPAMLAEVTAVHDAACHRNYDELQARMDDAFSGGSPAAAIAELRRDDGAPLTILAQTLETPPMLSQGGLLYCHPHGAVAAFARGTHDHPAKWSEFSLVGDPAVVSC